jgi:putative peptide zinc metalloprotease protein
VSTPSRSTRKTGVVPLVAASAPEKAAAALAARHGAADERPSLRPDAVVRRQVQMGEVRWWVKNTETQKHYLFYDHEWRLIELMDGSRTRAEVVSEYNELYPFDPIDAGVVLNYEEMLRKISLLAQSSAARNLELLQNMKTARQRAAEERAEGFNPFYILFHVMDPNRFLDRTVKYVRWIWSPPVVAVWSVAVAWMVCVFALYFHQLWAGTYELYAFLHKPLLDAIQFFFILSFLGFFHEFGHAYATKIYGGEVHDIGIALLYFTPAFYCDTIDALLFESKWHRLWVTTAGIYVEGFVCSGATLLWVLSYPDTLINEIAYKTMLFTGISTIFFNINPLIKIDGYYALTSFLEMPDLREDSFKYIGAAFQRYILRLPVEVPPVSRRRRRIFLVYGALALAYTAVIMRLIGGIFFNLYNKLFPDVAVVLLVLTLYRIFRKRVRLVTRTGRLFYLDKKELLMSRRSWIALAAAALVLLLLVPWSRRTISSESVLRPGAMENIEASEDGVVTAVLAREGASVRPDDPLFQLANLHPEANEARFASERRRLAGAARGARENSAAGAVREKELLESAAMAAVRNEQARGRRLTLHSSISGRILTHRPEDLAGRFVTAGTLLAEVGNCNTLIAELPVSERRLDELAVGAPVRAFLPQRPLRPIRGTIVRISAATLGQPRSLKGAAEPEAPEIRPDRFAAVALFENPGGELRPGDLVRAKIYSKRSSFAAGVWRTTRRWLQTILW